MLLSINLAWHGCTEQKSARYTEVEKAALRAIFMRRHVKVWARSQFLTIIQERIRDIKNCIVTPFLLHKLLQ